MIVIILIKTICSNKNARVFLLKLQKLTISKSKKKSNSCGADRD